MGPPSGEWPPYGPPLRRGTWIPAGAGYVAAVGRDDLRPRVIYTGEGR